MGSTDKSESSKSKSTGKFSVSSSPAFSRKAPWRVLTPNIKRTGVKNRRLAIGVIAVVVIGILSGLLGGWLEAQGNGDNLLDGGTLSNQKKVVTSQSQLISQIAKTVGQSVVSVNVVSQQQSATDFFGFSQPVQQQSAGTGIIISKAGLIITNRHVVPAGTTNVSVTLSDGTELKDVKVVGRTSQSDSLDIAFLKINNAQGKKLVPAVLDDSSNVQVGDAVVAIGNALGQFQNTVTSGIISGYGRSVQASDQGSGNNAENLTDLFQTDAAINEGNSGGPLVNMNGQVIGINTAIAGNAQNIGFSIPINDAKGLIKQVLASGSFAQPYLGIAYVPLTADYAYQYNLNADRGAYIAPGANGQSSVMPGSPADKAGLQEKDIITQVDGVNVDESHSLTSLLDQHQPGDTVNLTVVRGNQTLHVKLTLGSAPNSNS